MDTFQPEFRDMLPGGEEKPIPPASRGVYVYCHVLWFVSLTAIPVFAVFNRSFGIYSIIMFAAVLIAGALSGSALSRKPTFSFPHGDSFGKLVFAVTVAGFVVTLAALAALLIYGGSPEITPDGYAIIDHNIVVRSVTEREYKLLCAAEALLFVVGIADLAGSTLLFARSNCPESIKPSK